MRGIINQLVDWRPSVDWCQRDIDTSRETFVRVRDGYAEYAARVPETLPPDKFFAQVPYLFTEYHEHTPWREANRFEAVLFINGKKADERMFWIDPAD